MAKKKSFCSELKRLIKEEQDAGSEYKALAKKTKSKAVKKAIMAIANQESKHKDKLEEIYDLHCIMGIPLKK